MLGNRRASVVFALITVFIDVLGMGLVFPIPPRLVQHLMGGAIGEASFAYGLLLAIYAVMQFICAPIFGALSDRFGRRPVLLLALAGLGFDYVLLSLAPTSRGWSSAESWLASSAPPSRPREHIADVSPAEKRAANFGLIGIAFGLGFIAGPALGGLLGEANLRLPFVVCAALTFGNFLFGLLVMPESLRPENRRAIDWRHTNPLGALQAVWRHKSVPRSSRCSSSRNSLNRACKACGCHTRRIASTGASPTLECLWRSSACSSPSSTADWCGRW
jgi:MFS transporter, DHA1 family, tetracycline resistance protein